MSALPLSLHKKEMPNRISFLQGAPSATPNSFTNYISSITDLPSTPFDHFQFS
jgi:hypothetical protein